MTLITAQCPTCGADRNAHVIAEHEEVSEPTEEPLDPTYQGKRYRILKCAGCDTVYFQQERLQIVADDSDDDERLTGFDELKDYATWLLEHDPNRYVYEETSYWPAYLPKRRPIGISSPTAL